MVDHVRIGDEIHQSEEILHLLADRTVGHFRAFIRHGAHHLLAERLLVVDKIDAVAFALAHLAGSVETGHLYCLASEIEVDLGSPK